MDKSDKAAFIPSKLDLVLLFTIATFLLVVLNFKQILAFVVGDVAVDIDKEVLPLIQDFLLDKLSVVTADTATFIFWLAFGFSGLLLIEAIIWLIRLYLSDVPHRGWVHPRTYGYSGRDIVLHFVIRSVALLGLISWAVLLFILMLPLCNELFLGGLQINIHIYKTILAIVALGTYIYVAGVLVRLLILRSHIFS